MSVEITRIFDFAYYQLDKYNLSKALVSKSSGQWVSTSSKEFITKANIVSRGLLALGVKPGDKDLKKVIEEDQGPNTND